ncbi:MAG: fumarate hydratase [Candidatus Omnitrophica bacterium]|nr:fumarate hydratase [Candidatus Omnitrophota bacterium]
MRTIKVDRITQVVAELCIRANLFLRKDVLNALRQAYFREKSKMARCILGAIIKNAKIARQKRLPLCQDTGIAVVFLELGQDVRITGGNLNTAINKGIELGYRKGYLRDSMVAHPLLRGKPVFSGGVIHIDLVKGSRIKITVLAKGFGCENKTALKMFKPTAGWKEVKHFIIETVKNAGPDACPPYIVGVGLGGTAEYAMFLAKKALLRKITTTTGYAFNAKLESDCLKDLNQLNLGPMGLGGKTTALAVNIETHPTHITGLPVAVNISCHALRSATTVL